MSYHVPVMARESLEYLAIRPDGTYVDATFGGGGHSRLILEQLGPQGRLVAFDQDPDAQGNLPEDERLLFAPANFRHLKRYLRLFGIRQIDGLLADLGVSSHQLDIPERGFSFRYNAELDMRMDPAQEVTAAVILAQASGEELQHILGSYGEVRNARTLALQLVQTRDKAPLRTIADLIAVAEPLARGQRNRYLAQVFQALRIAVNDEMGALEEMLEQAADVLRPGGRLVAISYHSLEDRLVKNVLKTGNAAGQVNKDFYGHIYRPFSLLNKKPLEAAAAEVADNPRARSAKLRAGERLDTQPPAEAPPES
ncbi:MAG: 16S rRNA (cytosine(1402)-N(4))-methyltransferase RsmH [Lewinella sp.]|nr:16S rRNA (cytosine(1402)-N(4))-methyltransferase RsmH [Lewinella sp.]